MKDENSIICFPFFTSKGLCFPVLKAGQNLGGAVIDQVGNSKFWAKISGGGGDYHPVETTK